VQFCVHASNNSNLNPRFLNTGFGGRWANARSLLKEQCYRSDWSVRPASDSHHLAISISSINVGPEKKYISKDMNRSYEYE
jgi:hypothetical protein